MNGCRTLLICICMLVGCTPRIELFSGLSEHDANEVTSALMQMGINGEKVATAKQGFIVMLPKADLARAVAQLNNLGLPRNKFQRMGDVFKKENIVSTPLEERSRYLYALSQELESTLSQIDGVILARVHPVLPEKLVPGAPAQSASCSVLIKHKVGWSPILYEEHIRNLIVSSIPGLSRAQASAVSIVFVPAEPLTISQGRQPEASWSVFGNLTILEYVVLALLSMVVLISSAILAWQWQMQLRSSRFQSVSIAMTRAEG